MNISTWSIRNPIPPILLFLVLSVAGFYSFRMMKIQSFPDMDVPTVTVSAALPEPLRHSLNQRWRANWRMLSLRCRA